MIARCPQNPEHKRFVTVATVVEEWIVDEHGHFLDEFEGGETQTLHGPDVDNNWMCAECGTRAEVSHG